MNDFSDWQNQGRLTDEGLVLACREGDETAWEELIRRYERLVYSIPQRAGLDRGSGGGRVSTGVCNFGASIGTH